MGHPRRIEYSDAYHHVTARGNSGHDIFRTRRDGSVFLATLATAVAATRWRCLAYCLMPTHYHMLLQTPELNLSQGMHFVNTTYAAGFNAAHGHVGHVFQKRFHSELITRDPHLVETMRYIVLNPVRAGLVKRPDEWMWSSYAATAGLARSPRWLAMDRALGPFTPHKDGVRERYRQFVHAGIGQRSTTRPTLEQLIHARSPGQIATAHARYGYTQVEIAAYLGVSQPTVSRLLQAGRKAREY